jgi:carboxypeptidase family protein
MPGVRISLADQARTISREVTTDMDGLYNFPALPPAVYEIRVSAPGFVTQMWTGIIVGVGTERVINIVMRPGDPKTVVRTTAPPAPISQASACCGGNVNASTVRETPLNGRDWAQLATLQAGVTGVQTGSATGGGNVDRGFGAPVSISGARPDQNSYRLDGISINDYANGAPGSVLGDNLGIDAVEQISVLGSNYPAAYGRTSGGVINAVTRSGTNAFHGDVYEFLRNSALDARNFFDSQIPPFKRNQFGGSAGLPIQKDRTFIFGDYEGLRQSLGVTTVDTVPSAAVRGIGTGPNGGPGPSILCSIPQGPPNPCSPHPLTGAFQPDPTTGIDKSILKFLQGDFYPLPNKGLLGNGDTGVFTFAGQQITNENYFTLRLDHKFSGTDSARATYMRDSSKTAQPDEFNELRSDIVSARQVASLHEQHVFGTNSLNAARFGFSRAVGTEGRVSSVINQHMRDFGYSFAPGEFVGGVRAVPGVTDFTGGPTQQGFNRSLAWNSFQGGDDFFLTRGIHAISLGGVVERMQSNELSTGNVNGVFRFDSLSDFLTDRPRVFQGLQSPAVPDVGLRQTLVGAYFQDDIRLRRNFVFNAGLRYEMVTVPTEAHNRISNLQNLTDALPRRGAPFFQNPTLRNFEPRVGFAWNPRGGKTLVRSGFGVFDVLPLPYEFNLSFQRAAPFVNSVFSNAVPQTLFLNPSAFPAFSQQAGSALGTYVEQKPKRNYVMQWNLSVARELSSTLAFTVGYVGSRGVHLPYRVDNIDMVRPTPMPAGYLWPCGPDGGKDNPCAAGFLPTGAQSNPVPSSVLNPNFGRIDSTLWQANSFYHALQADLAKRVSRGIEFHAAYTWGKSIDTLSATEADDAFPNGLFNQLFFDQRTSRGLSDFNVAQTLVLNFTWVVPALASNSALLEWSLGGWQFGGVYRASTGQPFTPILGGDPAAMKLDETGELPGYIPGCNLVDPNFKKNPAGPIYIDRNCLSLPQATPAIAAQCQPFGFVAGVSAGIPGTCANLRGNLGRNVLIGPGISNLDFSVFKNNPVKRISETFNAQFRGEFFNILNRANFASPTQNLAVFDQTGLPVPSAGLITSTQTTSRQIQFALKFIW